MEWQSQTSNKVLSGELQREFWGEFFTKRVFGEGNHGLILSLVFKKQKISTICHLINIIFIWQLVIAEISAFGFFFNLIILPVCVVGSITGIDKEGYYGIIY